MDYNLCSIKYLLLASLEVEHRSVRCCVVYLCKKTLNSVSPLFCDDHIKYVLTDLYNPCDENPGRKIVPEADFVIDNCKYCRIYAQRKQANQIRESLNGVLRN